MAQNETRAFGYESVLQKYYTFHLHTLQKDVWLLLLVTTVILTRKEKKQKRKDPAGSDDTASMIKGGGYLGARTRQPPTAQTIRKILMWVRGVVCRSTRTQSLTVLACVIMQCIQEGVGSITFGRHVSNQLRFIMLLT
jgi:uncharacterized membrane protein